MRCAAKKVYPYCAKKGVDVGQFLQRFIPHLSMMSGGLVDLNLNRIEFKKARVSFLFIFNSIQTIEPIQTRDGTKGRQDPASRKDMKILINSYVSSTH